MKKSLLPTILISSLTLNACSTITQYIPWVYKIDIKQGNIVDQEMINQLRRKMTKRQVLYIMGSPMLNDYFNKQRWDYVYNIRERGYPKVEKHAALFFNGDELVKIEGDFKPSSTPILPPAKESSIVITPRKLDRTMWEKITGLFDWSSEAPPPDEKSTPNQSNNIPLKKF